jgi:hypothetical protein
MAIQETPASSPATPPAVRASDAERQAAAARLKQASVEGRITLEEFGERVGRVLAARTRAELDDLTHDLPAPLAAGSGSPDARRKPISTTVALMSAVERTGSWRVGETSRAIAVMGECKLDLRRAALSAAVTVIRAHVVMGNLKVIVPEGVDVDLDATTIMGSRKVVLSGPPAAPDAPLVRVEGLVLMGELTVRDRP